MSGRVFRRAAAADPPVAVEAHGSTIVDAEGREYLDAAGGAIVVNVGHGRREIADAMADQAARLAYAHGSAFTTEPLERYAAEVAPHLPMADPAIYPVSGGSEAIETALKLARATHLARGEPDRLVVFARWGSYHGNTLGRSTCPGDGRSAGRTKAGSAGSATSARPIRTARRSRVAGAGDDAGPRRRARRGVHDGRPRDRGRVRGRAHRGGDARRVEPPKGYWPAVADACRRHGALLIADEVMTGFGRTGAWFGLTHYAVQPDLLVAAKGATSGYWPFGFVAASGDVFDTVTGAGPFVHGFTYSHQPTAAAVALEVLRILETESLIPASATKGDRLLALLHERLDANPAVGDIRGRGLLVGVELVRDRGTREPYRGRRASSRRS